MGAYTVNSTGATAAAGEWMADACVLAAFLEDHLVHRRDTYFRQSRDGRGYARVAAPVTTEVLCHHVAGRLSVALCSVHPRSGTVRAGALDIDILKEVLDRLEARGLTPAAILDRFATPLVEVARAALQVLGDLQVDAIIEFSGNRGLHTIVVADRPVPVDDMRRLLTGVAKKVAPHVAKGISLEVYPKTVGPNGFDTPLKLPFALHRKSGRRSRVLCSLNPDELTRDPDEVGFFRQQAELVKAIVSTPAVNVLVAAEMMPPVAGGVATPRPAPSARSTTPNRAHPTPALGPSALERPEPCPDVFAAADVAAVHEGCGVSRLLKRRAKRKRNLTHAERLLLARIFACLGPYGRAYIHRALELTNNYDQAITERQLDSVDGLDPGGLPLYRSPTCQSIRRQYPATCDACPFRRATGRGLHARPIDLALHAAANRIVQMEGGATASELPGGAGRAA